MKRTLLLAAVIASMWPATSVWAQGEAGVEVPMTIYRDGETLQLRIKSGERNKFLKGPSLQ